MVSGNNPKCQVKGWRRGLKERAGKVGWIILWLLGVPIPILLLLFLVRGCT